MKSLKNINLSIRARRILFAFSLVLIAVSVAALTFFSTDSVFVMNLSAKTMATVQQSTPSSSKTESTPAIIKSALQVVSSESSSQIAVSSSSAPPSSSVSSAPPPMDPAIYQAMYPDLYAEKAESTALEDAKVVYLTFDDGPSNLTIPLLDVLDQYKVKATFFLIGKTDTQSMKEMKEIVDRGNVVGVHSYSHQYNSIYATPAAFLDDFAKMHDLLIKATGVDTKIYRYAGGSENSYNRNTAKAIINEMNRRGYRYYDWNVSSGDAERGATAQSIYTQTINGVHGHSHSVVLFHNTKFKRNTLLQMSKIIQTLQKEGYHFATLDPSIDNKPYIFKVS